MALGRHLYRKGSVPVRSASLSALWALIRNCHENLLALDATTPVQPSESSQKQGTLPGRRTKAAFRVLIVLVYDV